MKKLILFILLLLLIFSCCRFNENKYIADPDDLYRFLNDEMYKKVNMNDYKYVFYVDSAHPYSYTLKIKLKELKGKRYKTVVGECAAYLFSLPSYINLVFEVRRKDSLIYWNSMSLDSVFKSILKWSDLKFSMNINVDTLLDNDELKFYLWSTKSNPCYIGKMVLTFE